METKEKKKNEVAVNGNGKMSLKQFFEADNVQKKFQDMLGKRAAGFITSVLQICSQNALLADADPASIYGAAATAATLDLPLNQNLGFAYIIPYNQKQPDGTFKKVAQFQMGYKGFIQLAQRSGQFKTISSAPIYEGQIATNDPLKGMTFNWEGKKSDVVIGYAAYFQLINGFEKVWYMDVDQIKRHGQKFSKTYANKYGLWSTDFDGMATKTVIKLLLSKFAPLTIDLQKAVIADQALIDENENTEYVDHEEVLIDPAAQRIAAMISDATKMEHLDAIEEFVQDGQLDMFNEKKKLLEGSK